MDLYGTDTSPYVRKVRLVVCELGLQERVAYHRVDLSDPPQLLRDANPTARVPTLITDDGLALFDSPVIAEWLDATFGNHTLLPGENTPSRWRVLRTQALGDGLLDSATSVRHETQRPAQSQSQSWIEKHIEKVRNALASLNQDTEWRSSDQVDLGQIAVASAVGYIRLRFAELLKAGGYPSLVAWYDRFSSRPSMIDTAPR